MGEFSDQVALVTGGSRGIGRAIVLELARRGAAVAFCFRSQADEAEKVAGQIRSSGGSALTGKADVTDLEQCKAFVAEVKGKLGRIDVLVNNAGVTRDGLLMTMKEEDWDAVIRTNLYGVYHMTRAAAVTMMKAKKGSILNIASVSGLVGIRGQANYAAAKAGVMGFTRALAREMAPVGINANALALGFVETEMTGELDREQKLKEVPLGRFGTVEEAAQVAAFLVSPAARYITGQVVVADGGLSM